MQVTQTRGITPQADDFTQLNMVLSKQVTQTKGITPQADDFTHLNMVLSKQGRKLYHVAGDGNCFFRALSYIIHKTEGHHASIRASLVLFTELNTFEQYCTTESMKDHIQRMRHERVWAT